MTNGVVWKLHPSMAGTSSFLSPPAVRIAAGSPRAPRGSSLFPLLGAFYSLVSRHDY